MNVSVEKKKAKLKPGTSMYGACFATPKSNPF
jgi:hypothetical protein